MAPPRARCRPRIRTGTRSSASCANRGPANRTRTPPSAIQSSRAPRSVTGTTPRSASTIAAGGRARSSARLARRGAAAGLQRTLDIIGGREQRLVALITFRGDDAHRRTFPAMVEEEHGGRAGLVLDRQAGHAVAHPRRHGERRFRVREPGFEHELPTRQQGAVLVLGGDPDPALVRRRGAARAEHDVAPALARGQQGEGGRGPPVGHDDESAEFRERFDERPIVVGGHAIGDPGDLGDARQVDQRPARHRPVDGPGLGGERRDQARRVGRRQQAGMGERGVGIVGRGRQQDHVAAPRARPAPSGRARPPCARASPWRRPSRRR